MKLIIFLAALFILVPLLARRVATSPVVRRWVVGLMGFSVFHRIDIGFMAEKYRGDSIDLEIALMDLLALSLFIAQHLRGARGRGVNLGSPFPWTRALYLGVVVLSMAVSPSLLLSAFSVWKLLRMYLLVSVLYVEFFELSQVRASLLGLGIGALTQLPIAINQRYFDGFHRATGSLPHANSLAMLASFVTPVALALLLAGHARRLNAAIVAAGALSVIMSLSRGGILMLAFSTAVVVVGSLARELELKKVVTVGSLMAGGLVLLVKSIDSIMERFTTASPASEHARVLFNLAAEAMADERPLGVGINMFSRVLEAGGYADRFELAPVDRTGIAHHIYWLTAAETGYIGLAAYALLLAVVLVTAIKCARAKSVQGDIALGITAGLIVTYIQGTAEWVARQSQMSYAFWTFAAIIAAQAAARKRAPG